MAVEGFTMSPPYGGLDLVSPIDNMEPIYALELINITPTASAPEVRKGYTLNATITGGAPVNTLRALPLQSGVDRLVAMSGASIWDIAAGVATNVTGTTPLTSSNCSTEIFSNRMFICNGVDTVQVYNGATTVDSTFTGVTLSTLVTVSSYKKRLYFVKKNTFQLWYGATSAVGGSALTLEELESIFSKGGYLLFAGSYTNQTAQTSADLFFACSSEGEIAFYAGSDPTDWVLVAKFYIGKPLGYNSFMRINQDVWILTQQGIVPVSALFQADPQQALLSVSGKINPLISQAANLFPFSYRWHGVFFPAGNKVLIQVPTSETSTTMLVWDMDTKGWTRYVLDDLGNAISMAMADKSLYYSGSTGKVFNADTGQNDNGNPINFTLRSAFSFYGARGNFKAFKDCRPLLKTQRGQSFVLGLDTDFKKLPNTDTITSTPGTTTAWGAPWGSPWSGGSEYVFDRFAVRGQGHSAAIKFIGSVKDSPLQILGFEVRFDIGGQV